MAADGAAGIGDAVARYKALLREFVDRRPSGLRGRLARALGKHKSFVTQITSPAYSAPIPAKDLATLFAVCHLSAEERAQFMAAYEAAHPERARRARVAAKTPHEIRIVIPAFGSAETARSVETLILDFAGRVIMLAQKAESRPAGQNPHDQESTP